MVRMVTEVLKHIKAELAHGLDAPTMLALCREVRYQWRPRLREPVTTVHLFMLQILHENTACRLAAVGASDVRCLRADDPRRGTVAWPPHVLGGRVQFFDTQIRLNCRWCPPGAAWRQRWKPSPATLRF